MRGNPFWRCPSGLTFAVLALLAFAEPAEAQVYILYRQAGIVNKFDVDTGALIKERFIDGLTEPRAICLDGGDLYVLQQSGVVSKYDAVTGAAINERFISGFNMPQAMAVSSGVVYVASFAWGYENQFQGQAANLVGKYDAKTGAEINRSFLHTDQLAAGLMVSGNKLFALCAGGPNSPGVFDLATGQPIKDHHSLFLSSSAGSTCQGDWIWFTAGHAGAGGMVFKYNINTGQSAVAAALFGQFIRRIENPSVIAISGDELFIGCGPSNGTAVSKYDAITGDLIKADFIADRGDHFAGIAVAPRASLDQPSLADAQFAVKNTMMSGLFWMSTNGQALDWIAAVLVLLVILGLATFLYYRPSGPEPQLVSGPEGEVRAGVPPAGEATIPGGTLPETAPAQTPAAPAKVEPSAWPCSVSSCLRSSSLACWCGSRPSRSISLTRAPTTRPT